MDKQKKTSDLDLYNRYGEKIWLNYIGNEGYDLIYSLEGNLDYARFIYENNEMTDIHAIDPSGGPYMAVDLFKIKDDTLTLSKIIETESETSSHNTSGRILMYFKPSTPLT